MTYQQALAILYSRYSNPLAVSGTERLKAMTSAGVPLAMASDINLSSYNAISRGTTLEAAMQRNGYLTSATTTTSTSTPTVTTAPTTTTSEVPTISVSSIFNTPTTTSLPSYVAPTYLASQESGAIGATSIASQLAAPTTTTTQPVPVITSPFATPTVTSTPPTYLSPQPSTTSQTPTAPISVPSFVAPTAVTSTAPTTYAPSSLAAQESGAIGAASIASQMAAAPTVAVPPLSTTSTRTASTATINTNLDNFLSTWNRSDITKPTFFYDPVAKQVYVSQGQNFVLPAEQQITDAVNSGQATISGGRITNTATGYSAGTGTWLTSDKVLPLLPSTAVSTYNAKQVQPPSTATSTSTSTTPPITTAPTTTTAEVPTVQNPITTPPPTGQAPTISVPKIPATTSSTTVSPTMGGSLEDQIAYMSAIRRATAAKAAAEVAAKQQRADIGTQYEPQIRRAGREMYNQQIKALAALGARGLAGAPGLSVAARRAGMAAPAMQYTGLINERQRQLGALERTLASQLADYEETLRASNEQLTRATTLANQLTGTGQ